MEFPDRHSRVEVGPCPRVRQYGRAEACHADTSHRSRVRAILHEAGAPPGVFNLVIGEGDVGRAIVNHEDIDGISFTGSQEVGAKRR